jgi:iron complex outermembrane recepter protein
VPTNALMVVDLNSIPSAMLRSVEIISGGASATYGADAMGGVSNMLLRRNFEGLETDFQWGISDVGDNQEKRASVIAGTKLADGRGNLVFAAEYYDRQAAYDKKRKFYTDAYEDPTVGGNFLGFVFGANGYSSQTFGTPNANAIRAAAGAPSNGAVCGFSATAAGNISCTNAGFRFNPDTSIFLPATNAYNLGSWDRPRDDFRYSVANVYNSGLCTSGAINPPTATPPNVPGQANCGTGPQQIQVLKYNETEGYTSSPQSRYSFMGSATYDITDKLHVMSSARFAQSKTRTFLAGTNASFGWEVTVPYNPTIDSPLLPTLNYSDYNVVQAALANPTSPLYANPNYRASGTAGAAHPVPPSMAVLLNSRPTTLTGTFCLYNQPGCTALTNPATQNGNTSTRDINLVGQARTGATAPWIMETFPLESFGRRATDNVNDAWQIELGVTYDLPFKDWTSEVYYSRGESSNYNVAFGNNSLARWRALINSPDYGRGAVLQSNLTNNPGASPGFGSVATPCTSGFYDTIFKGDTPSSADCRYAAEASLQTRTQNQQDIFELNLQGGLVELPGGEVRTAFGYQQRRNASQFNPDILQSTASFTDQVIGVYPNGYLRKQSIAKDIWAEALIPIVKGLPFLKVVELEVGGRHSQYSTTSSTDTYKINANVQVNDWLRFRGGYNKATRAPNLGELFLPLQQNFTGSGVYGDSCSLLSNSPFGAGGAILDGQTNPINPINNTATLLAPGQTRAGAQSAYLICKAMMGPAVSQWYGSTSTSGGGLAAAAGSAWNNQIGNANLESEKAKTYTAGMVLRSPWQHPLLNRSTLTVDWYKIGIDDAILLYSADYAAFRCFGEVQVATPEAAEAQARSAACGLVPRNQTTGGGLSTLLSYDNQAWVKTSGVDFTFNWAAQLADMGLTSIPGGLTFSVTGSYLNSYKTKTSPAPYDPVVEWKGTLGPTLTSFNGGAYDYRLFTSLGYNLSSVGVNLRWRHLPEVEPTGKATIRANIKNNEAVDAGEPGLRLGWTPSVAYNVPQYDQFDLSGYWNINSMLSMRFGVNNVLDTQPSISGKSAGRPYDPSQTALQNAQRLAATCNGQPTGCVNPTGYTLATSGKGTTNVGFYDIVGRSYFVGVKARF